LVKFEKIETPESVGASLNLFWLLKLTFLYNSYRGDHISIGVGFWKAETSLQLSIWN